MLIQKNCDFLTTSIPMESKSFTNSSADVLALQISGADGVYYLEGRNKSTNDWVSLAGISLSDFSAVIGGFKKAGMYEVGIIGVREVRVRVESTQGKVTIFGQMISTEET